MKKLLFVAIAIGALFYFKPALFHFSGKSGAFDSKGNPLVLVFTGQQCNGFCEKATQELKERKVDFQELTLDGNDENINHYKKLGGNGQIPFLVVGNLTLQAYDRGMYASVLAQTYGDHALTPLERIYFKRHFNADGSPKVYMYGATWCGFCTVMREEMAKRKIEFSEIDVDMIADRAEVESAMDLSALPVTYVGYVRFVGSNSVDPVVSLVKTAGRKQM